MSPYQIAIFATGPVTPHADILRTTIQKRFDELGIPPAHLTFLDESAVATRDRKAPTVGVYFGFTGSPSTATPALSDLLGDATMIVPVVPDLTRFSEFVPAELKFLNGMTLRSEDPGLDHVASVLLEGLGLLRRSRRLFISYRRVEAQSVAIQLYELLDRHGFDVFLDSHSIRPGEPFQEVLWHRLADTDVIVLLDSPGFLSSRWTVAELAQANSTNIQILQMIWPGNTLHPTAAFSIPFTLKESDFLDKMQLLGMNARLEDSCLESVAAEVESLRARALAARHAYLVQEFCTEAHAAGFDPQVQPERCISIETKSGDHIVTVPAVGVPDAARYQEIEDNISHHPKAHREIICCTMSGEYVPNGLSILRG
jgi:hypothetical protein